MYPDTFLYLDTNVDPLRLHLKGYKRVSGDFYVSICIHFLIIVFLCLCFYALVLCLLCSIGNIVTIISYQSWMASFRTQTTLYKYEYSLVY